MPKPSTTYDAVTSAIRRTNPALFAISAGVNLLLLVSAIYMLQIYDRVLASGSFDTLIWLSVIALFAIAIYGVLEQARRLVLSRTGVWIDRELTAPVVARRMEARLAGEASNAGPRDVADLRNYYQGDAALALHDAPWSIVFIAFIWALHPTLGMIALFGGIILFSGAVINDVLTRPQQMDAANAVRQENEAAIRFLDGGETIRPLGMAGALFDRWRARAAEARAQQQALGERTTTILSASRAIRLGLQVIILGAGAYLVLGGQITAGAMIAASIVLGRALAPIERVTGAWRRLVAARSARKVLKSLFEDEAQREEALTLPAPKGHLTAEDVWYRPAGAAEPILRNISFDIRPGQACAILGPSGSGKSSLCRLIVGAWKPTAGHMRLDGADVFDWDPAQLGPHIGYLPQRVDLFPGSVAQNIGRFGELDSDRIVAAAKAAGVHDLILALPNGYDTEVGENTHLISLGQRQRIGLARALFGDPALVVLDEPNANLDRAGDEGLRDAIEALREAGKTVIIVTHRAPILKLVDTVMTLQGGQVTRFGPTEEVVRSQVPGESVPSQTVVPGPDKPARRRRSRKND